MALSGKYGKIDVPKIGEDEPVFILRAQDKLAGPGIEMYRALVASPMALQWQIHSRGRFTVLADGAVRRRYRIS